MIGIVADTNVYISAVVFGGVCESILTLARAGIIELRICPAITQELKRVLGETFGWTAAQVSEAEAEIKTLTSLFRPSGKRITNILGHDPDHRILECAVAARAEFLVTGDKRHLLPLKNFHGIPIVSPRDFLAMLGSR